MVLDLNKLSKKEYNELIKFFLRNGKTNKTKSLLSFRVSDIYDKTYKELSSLCINRKYYDMLYYLLDNYYMIIQKMYTFSNHMLFEFLIKKLNISTFHTFDEKESKIIIKILEYDNVMLFPDNQIKIIRNRLINSCHDKECDLFNMDYIKLNNIDIYNCLLSLIRQFKIGNLN